MYSPFGLNTHIDLLDLCIHMHNKFGKAASSPITRMIFLKALKSIYFDITCFEMSPVMGMLMKRKTS